VAVRQSRPRLSLFPLTSALAVGSFVRAVSKNVTDYIISQKIDQSLVLVRTEILDRYERYWKNTLISGTGNFLIVLTALLSFFCFSVTPQVILCISLMTVALAVRNLVLTAQALIAAAPYASDIWAFIRNIFRFRSLPEAFRELVRVHWRRVYAQYTNGITRTAHSLFSKIGMVKPAEEIETDILDEYYHLAKDFVLKVIASKAAFIAVFYGFFVFFLRSRIFAHAIHMNTLEILVYPFTVSIPAAFRIIIGG
jgi:hypothetical protein